MASDLKRLKQRFSRGHSVRALARSAIPIQNANLDKVSGDALDSDTIRNALQDVDVVIQALGVDIAPRAIFERTTLFSQSTRILEVLLRYGSTQGLTKFALLT